jgi:hypothetical protein
MTTTQQQILTNLFALTDQSGNQLFSSTSAVSLARKIADAMAPIIDNTLSELIDTQTIIQNIINNQRYGRSGYYTSKALLFQYSSSADQILTPDPVTNDPEYAVIDTTLQIISQAAFDVSGSNILILKVAALSGTTLGPLTTLQMNDFKSYFTNFEIPGLPVQIISTTGNVINFIPSIIYSASTDLAALQSAIQSAIIAYQNTFPFNGYFYCDGIYGLTNYLIANVPGLIDVSLSGCTVDVNPFFAPNIYTKLLSGYFLYDPSVVGKFNNSANYTAI